MVSCGSGEVWDWREEEIGKSEEAKVVGQWGRINGVRGWFIEFMSGGMQQEKLLV